MFQADSPLVKTSCPQRAEQKPGGSTGSRAAQLGGGGTSPCTTQQPELEAWALGSDTWLLFPPIPCTLAASVPEESPPVMVLRFARLSAMPRLPQVVHLQPHLTGSLCQICPLLVHFKTILDNFEHREKFREYCQNAQER